MRPTVTEQLDGLRRILAEVVVPEVQDPYPADILTGVMAALDALGRSWYEIPRFLRWDIQASVDLLTAALPGLPADLATALGEALRPDGADPFDLEALEARHERVRGALVLVAPSILADPDLRGVRAQMLELFRERARRFPFALVSRAPAPPTATAVPDGGK